jgi:hypothetical protein
MNRTVENPLPGYSTVLQDNYVETQFDLDGIGGISRAHSMIWDELENVLENSANTLKHTGSETNCINTGYSPVTGGVLFPDTTPNGAIYHEYLDPHANATWVTERERTCDTGVFNPKVLSRITLPNGKYYQFKYNEYGEITRIDYPSGAFERFEYQMVPMMGGRSHQIYAQGNRGVHKRYVSFDGTNIAQTWTYDASDSQGYHVTITAPDGSYSVRDLQVSDNSAYGFDDPLAGMIKEGKNFDSSSAHNLRSRTITDWKAKGPQGTGASPLAERDPRVERTVTITFEPNSNAALATMTKLEYDDSGSTDPSHFSHLNLKRKTTYHYAVISNKTTVDDEALNWTTIESWFTNVSKSSIAETSYYYDASYRTRGIIGLPWESRAMDPTNGTTVLTKTNYYYDNFTYPNAGSPSHWTDPNSNLRGNLTLVRSVLKDPIANTETNVDVASQYDTFGNLIKTYDAAGNVAETQYSSDYNYAYPTKVIAPGAGCDRHPRDKSNLNRRNNL